MKELVAYSYGQKIGTLRQFGPYGMDKFVNMCLCSTVPSLSEIPAEAD